MTRKRIKLKRPSPNKLKELQLQKEVDGLINFLELGSHRKVKHNIRKNRPWLENVVRLINVYDLTVDGQKLNKFTPTEDLVMGSVKARLARTLLTVATWGDEKRVREELQNLKDLGNIDARTLTATMSSAGNKFVITGYENVYSVAETVPGLNIILDEAIGSEMVVVRFNVTEYYALEDWLYNLQPYVIENVLAAVTEDEQARAIIDLLAPQLNGTINHLVSEYDFEPYTGKRYLVSQGEDEVIQAFKNVKMHRTKKGEW